MLRGVAAVPCGSLRSIRSEVRRQIGRKRGRSGIVQGDQQDNGICSVKRKVDCWAVLVGSLSGADISCVCYTVYWEYVQGRSIISEFPGHFAITVV